MALRAAAAALVLSVLAACTASGGDASRPEQGGPASASAGGDCGRPGAEPHPGQTSYPPGAPSRAGGGTQLTPAGLPRLTWPPPALAKAQTLRVTRSGRYDLRPGTDYRIEAPQTIRGPVELRGGRNVVWVGGHISIPAAGPSAAPIERRALIVSDPDDAREGPPRTIHLEGLLIDGPGLAEGIDTDAPTATVQLENIRVVGVHFRDSDDRDGVGGPGNHPDIVQIWGSQRELRIDGLTGSSSYQGLFLKEDVPDAVHGPIWLRRVDLTAIATTGTDGLRYAGTRMLSFYRGSVGALRFDSGTVRVVHNPDGGWVAARPNPAADSGAFWRTAFRTKSGRCPVREQPPGTATFTDTLGSDRPDITGRDRAGRYAGWTSGATDWDGNGPGKVYDGLAPGGSYVPPGVVGTDYRTPGYQRP